jgi:plasmid stabilization system protein ParE
MRRKYKVTFRAEARGEAVDAARYISKHADSETALRWYEGLEAAIKSLEDMPLRCPPAREHGAFPGIDWRQLVYASHRLIFMVEGDTVHVLHVRHTAQKRLL